MVQRLAIEHSHHFVAIAVVAASLSEWLASRFTPSRSMPILFIHGTADTVTPYIGGRQPGGARVLSVENTVKIWAHFNGCNKSPEAQEIHGLDNIPLVSVFTYDSCKSHSQVKLYRIEGGGHIWPGESEGLPKSEVGKLSFEIDASEEIWDLFEHISKVEKGDR